MEALESSQAQQCSWSASLQLLHTVLSYVSNSAGQPGITLDFPQIDAERHSPVCSFLFLYQLLAQQSLACLHQTLLRRLYMELAPMVQSCLPQPEHLFLNIIIIPSKPSGLGQACTASPTHSPEAPRHSQAARTNKVLTTAPLPSCEKLHLCQQTYCSDNADHVTYGDAALRESDFCSVVSVLNKPMIISHLPGACYHMCTATERTLDITYAPMHALTQDHSTTLV